MKRFAPVSTSILLFFGNRHNHITVFDETIFVSSMTLYPQAGQTYIHLLFLRCKMLVGKSQTLSDLHRSGAGYAFLPNAFECVNTNSLQKSESLFGASVNGITPMFVVE